MRGTTIAVLMMGAVLSTVQAWAQDQPAPSVVQPAIPVDAGAPPPSGETASKAVDPKKAAEDAEDQAMVRTIAEGVQLMRTGQVRPAIEDFDKVIATYDARYKDSAETLYCAGDGMEAMAYMLLAAASKHSARALPPMWAAAYFFRGFSLVELRDLPAAQAALERARDLSPYNSHYLNELGNLYKTQKNWALALETYQAAKEHVNFQRQNATREEAVTQHGIAYIYSETGKLDDAEAIYKACLEKNPQDAYAQHELAYVQQQKARQPHFQ
ncbi:MAG: tetratricopeptide repeat protein [Azospirillaceae bacterium]|nr:tetratricopeptide repeat protein [Azospirillaceae bacterium]